MTSWKQTRPPPVAESRCRAPSGEQLRAFHTRFEGSADREAGSPGSKIVGAVLIGRSSPAEDMDGTACQPLPLAASDGLNLTYPQQQRGPPHNASNGTVRYSAPQVLILANVHVTVSQHISCQA